MPNIQSAKKRVKVIASKTARNKVQKSMLKTQLKKMNMAIEAGDKAQAAQVLVLTTKAVDQAAAKGLLHKNTAANKKSGFAKRVAAL